MPPETGDCAGSQAPDATVRDRTAAAPGLWSAQEPASGLRRGGWRRRLALLALLGLGAPTPAAAAPGTVTTPLLQIYVVKVGQGDATLLVSASGTTALIDAGPQSSDACAGPSGIITTLSQLGLTRLDHFVASHYDADHIGCADEVLARWPATTVWDRGSSSPPSTQTYAAYVTAAGARRRTAVLGDTVTLGTTTLTVVAVNGNGRTLTASNQNDRGVVLRVRHGAFDGVLGGDISSTIETVLAPSLGSVEWYKVHHHGSATSSSDGWVATLTPKVATLSVGMPNAYDHPRSVTLETLRRSGTITYWTTVGDGAAPVAPSDVVANGTIELRINDTGTAFDVRTPIQTDGYAAWGASLPCAMSGAPADVTVGADGGMASLTLTAAAGCDWTAATNAAWLSLSASSGTGAGSLTLTVAANSGSEPRAATLTIAGQTVTVTQAAADRPLGLRVASITGNTVTLQWQWPGPAPDRYVLKGGLAQGQTVAILPIGSRAPAFTFDAPSGTFYVRIAGIRGGRELPVSDDVRIVVNVFEAPSAPTQLLGLANGSGLALSWTNTADGGAATGLVLDVSGALSASLPLALTDQFSFDGVPPGTYTFRVRATNAQGSSAASNAVTLSFPGACAAPAVPQDLEAFVVGNVVTIRWQAPASGAAATGYVLNVSGAVSLALPVTGRTLSSPAPPGTYTFTVAAQNACGTSAATSAQTVTIP